MLPSLKILGFSLVTPCYWYKQHPCKTPNLNLTEVHMFATDWSLLFGLLRNMNMGPS